MIVTSTPRHKQGPFFELVKEATASGLLLHGRSWEVNPLQSVIKDVRAQWAVDPALARREFAAQFTDEIGQVFSLELLEAATRPGGRLMPERGTTYYMVLDPSGVSGNDAFVAMIFHVDGAGVLVVDWWQSWTGGKGVPADLRIPADAIKEAAAVYRPRSITSDQYSFGAFSALLVDRGVMGVRLLNLDANNKVRALSLTRQRLLAGQLLLPAVEPRFVSELASLEVSRLPGGHERVAAPKGLHDDFSDVVLVAALVAEGVAKSSRHVTYGVSPWI